MWELDEVTASALAQATTDLAWILREALEIENLNVINSNGPLASQTIDHLHVHLVPRYKNDAIGRIWPEGEVVDSASEESARDQVLRKAAGSV